MAKPSDTLTPAPDGNSTEFASTSPKPGEYNGQYRKLSDGKVYGLCLKPDDHLGRTHKALSPRVEPDLDSGVEGHTGFFWEGSFSEFRAQFDKV